MSIYQKASLVQIPSGYKAADAKLYSVVPNSGDGDFTVSSDADATRVNKDGLVETIVANQARLNYDPTNPQDPHLLLEPSRTNYLTNSNNASLWGQSTSNGTVTTTANYSTAPDGSNEATRLEASVSGGSGFALLSKSTTSFFGDYTTFVYLKSNTGSNQEVCIYGRNTGNQVVTVTSEWQKFELNGSSTSGQSNFINVGINLGFVGEDNPIDVLIWGGQIEEGSYATSLIPTAGSAVTRTADTAKIEPYSALPSDYPLTVFWEGKIDNYNAGQFIFSIFGTGSAAQYLGFAWQSSSYFYLYRRSSTANDADLVSFSSNQDTNYKVAVSFISNTQAKVYINGSEVYDLTSGLDVDYEFNSVLIGSQRIAADNGFRNSAKQFMVFNEALTNAELQTLTS